LFVFVTLLVAITLPASCAAEKDPRPAWNSYSEFGFTFKYPPELNLKAADTATAEEGSISSIKPRENGKLLHLRWMRGISGKQSIAEKVLRPYIRSRAPQLGEGKFYLGESKWLKVHNQQTAFSRFCTSDEKGYFLNVVYAWYAEDSNRTFVLCCGAVWEHPEIITDGSSFVPRWPKLDDDPSYNFCQSVLKSFKDKAPAQIRHSSKATGGQDWIKLASLRGGKELKDSDSFEITIGEAKIRYTLTGERAVDGKLNQTSIMLFREGLTMTEAARKGGEGANIFPMKMVSGSGSGEYIEMVEPGTYSIYAYSPAGASWTLQVYEKRNHLEAPPKEPIVQEPAREDRLPKESVSLEEELYKQTKIAFTSKRDGNLEIYVMNADGSEQKRLTNNPAPDASPSWSPDGRKMALNSKRDGNLEIYVMNTDGSEQKRLTNNPAPDMAARWSPDGKKIAFMSKRDGNTDIYVMNTDGSEQKRLTNNPAPDAFPSWSPDGKKIAFSSKRDGNAEIYVMNTDGSEQKRLTNNPADDGTPSWSPLGKKIAFASTMDGNPEIYIMNADGNDQKRLTNNPANDGVPSWSPDGKKIAFTSQRDGNVDIYLMNADGSEQKRLTSNPALDMSSSWSPFLGSEK
jgi:Tol biopolymer transport system component